MILFVNPFLCANAGITGAVYGVRVDAFVYARHGHELMGLKSPTGNPVLSENLT